MPDPLYSVRDLVVEFDTRRGTARALDGVSLDIGRGEILGLVGESGCGKSTLGKALMRLVPSPGRITAGSLVFDGIDVRSLGDRELRALRGARIGMVFQDPMTSLNPIERVVDHLVETVRTHEPGTPEGEARSRARDLVERLGIRGERLDDYPHQLSGGMRQRIMIALALALRADLVIADEPTTALDVIVEAKFLDLLRELRAEFGLAILLITHNIAVVAEAADRVAVMYAGRIVEVGPVGDIFARPHHPYTEGLLRSVPNIDLDAHELYKMDGSPPSLLRPLPGCPFADRCPAVMDRCRADRPPAFPVGPDHTAACWLAEPSTPRGAP